jgi:hypothetical protein
MRRNERGSAGALVPFSSIVLELCQVLTALIFRFAHSKPNCANRDGGSARKMESIAQAARPNSRRLKAPRQTTETAAFHALSNLEGVHLGRSRRRDIWSGLMASVGAGLPGGIGLRLFCSRFRRAHRGGGCRFRLADSLGRHRRRRFSGCWGLRFGANHFSRRIVARVRRGNRLRRLRRPFCLFGILRLRRFRWQGRSTSGINREARLPKRNTGADRPVRAMRAGNV